MVTETLRLHLYTRAGCCLCADVRALLDRLRRDYSFDLQSTDIDTDEHLRKTFGDCVPVVLINGKIRFRGRIQAALLTRLLRNESARRSS